MAHQDNIVIRVAASIGYNCSISTRLPQLLTRALSFGNRMSPKCLASAPRLTVIVGGSAAGSALAIGHRGGHGHLLGLWTAAVGVVEGDRTGVELSVGAAAGDGAFGCGPTIGQRAAAIGTHASGAQAWPSGRDPVRLGLAATLTVGRL